MLNRVRVLGAARRTAFSTRSCTSSQSFNASRTYQKVDAPQPDWSLAPPPGTYLQNHQTTNKRKTWDFSSEHSNKIRENYRILTSAIVPRPIALVSTLSEGSVPNLAPFSYFSMLSHNPPLVSLSFSLSPRRPKDTRDNILATKQFTISLVSETIVGPANSASVEAPAEVDEWIISGLTKESSVLVKPPFVRESPVTMECLLHSYHDIHVEGVHDPITTVIFGLIKMVHVQESVLSEDRSTVDVAKLRPVARLGDTTYARVLEGFDLPRISWKEIREDYITKVKGL
ncbi:hypothetical protein BJ165DRAFT_1454002 [Panaeolus papilionaceus]|nr:hypothetical protein BJ165DRAFT_1454002 [Panaeolus papilionaceus]